ADDPRFTTMAGISANMGEVFDHLNAFITARNFDAVKEAFEAADAVAAPVLSVEDILEHPQIAHRGDIVAVGDEETRIIGPVPQLGDTPGAVRWLGRAPGADTAAILGELGYDAASIQTLADSGIIALEEGQT
ncbi:MAG: CoA transferase, partial [Rhodobacteraceae bacterium]